MNYPELIQDQEIKILNLENDIEDRVNLTGSSFARNPEDTDEVLAELERQLEEAKEELEELEEAFEKWEDGQEYPECTCPNRHLIEAGDICECCLKFAGNLVC